MAALFQLIADLIRTLWPFTTVEQWEHGVYSVCGKYWRTFGPGVYFVLPWFSQIRPVQVKPTVLYTDRLDVTLRDGTVCSLIASANAQVVDAAKALNDVDNYHQTTLNLLESIVADRIARVDMDRLDAPKRARLLTDLARWINAETRVYGVEITKVRFSSFILKARTYRFIGSGGATDTNW